MYVTTDENSWTEIKSRIKSRWSKFTDDEVESLRGNLDHLTLKLQKIYGYAKDHAEREYEEFMSSVKSTMNKTNNITHPGKPRENNPDITRMA